MSLYAVTKIFVIGGTGAQGIPIIEALVKDKKYHCRVLTRDQTSLRAKHLLALGNVEIIEGTFSDEVDLKNSLIGCDGAFINIDGFNTGEKAEMFWAIRTYELALEAGIKFLVYGNLDYGLKKAGYNSKFRVGHYDGKGRIGEWIQAQTKNNVNVSRMGAAIFTSGPYIDMVISSSTVMTPTIEDGVVTWRVPLGDGAVPHVALEDCGYYVRWLFDHPERSNGMDLEVAVADIKYSELAAAFEKVTGHPARYIDMHLDTYWKQLPGFRGDIPSGYNVDPKDKSAMTVRQNFTGFWNLFKFGILKRDYKLLDEIHPNRIRSAEEWFRMEDKKGREMGLGSLWERVQKENQKPILKVSEDGWKGKI